MPTDTAPARPRPGILARTTLADRGIVRLPALTPHLRFHDIGEGRVLLVSESFNTLLHGKLYSDLLPLLDGRHAADEIVAALEGAHAPADVLAALAAFAAKGYLVSADHGMDLCQAAYWSSLGASPRWAEERLAQARVTVEGDDGRLVRHLEEAGASVGGGDPALTVVVCADYLDAHLAEVNRRQLEAESAVDSGAAERDGAALRPHLPRRRAGPLLGLPCAPPAQPRGSPRVPAQHRRRGSRLQAVRGPAGRTGSNVRADRGGDRQMAGAARGGPDSRTGDRDEHRHIHEFAAPGRAQAAVPGVRRRGAAPSGSTARSGVSQGEPQAHRNSGGARAVSPGATLAKYRHLVSPVSGVVTWLSRTTDETDSWLHVYWAGSNPGMRSRSLSSLRRSLRSKSAGKGSTRQQSRVSALCEAIERHSGARHGDEIRVRKRFSEFAGGEEAIHPNDVQLFSESQLDNAESINAQGHPYNIVPPRLDPGAEIDWTPVWSLTQQRHRYLPTSILYSMLPEERGPADLVADSNGCAAGNTLEEAILQGFYELTERDAFAVWWYNRLRVPAVDLSSFDDEYLGSAPDYYGRHERDLWMLDVTSDIGIPTFVALSRRPDAPKPRTSSTAPAPTPTPGSPPCARSAN